MKSEVETRPHEIESRGKQTVEREQARPGPVFRPDVDIVETEAEVLVKADLPGVDEQHVDVRLEKGVLAIDATLAFAPEADWTPVYEEYALGGYHREFALSDKIEVDKITASLRDGVLELRLPKTDRLRRRSIEVRAG